MRVHNVDFIRRKDPAVWRLQYKWGGHHAVVSTHEDGHIFSRHGAPLSSAAKTDFSNLCARIFGMDSTLDGELMLPLKASGQPPWFVIWDIPVHQGRDLTQVSYLARLAVLAKHWTDFREPGRIRVAHNLWIAEVGEMKMLDAMLQRCDGKLIEGVVAKNISHHLNWSRIAQLDCTSQVKFRIEDLRESKPPQPPKLVS